MGVRQHGWFLGLVWSLKGLWNFEFEFWFSEVFQGLKSMDCERLNKNSFGDGIGL